MGHEMDREMGQEIRQVTGQQTASLAQAEDQEWPLENHFNVSYIDPFHPSSHSYLPCHKVTIELVAVQLLYIAHLFSQSESNP